MEIVPIKNQSININWPWLVLGALLVATDTGLNTEYLYDQEKAITSLVLAAPVAALAAAASLPAMEQAFQIRHYAKGFGFLLLAIVLGAFSLSASFDRTSSGLDAKQAIGRSSNELRSIALAKLNEAQVDRRNAERRIKDEAHPSCNWPRYLKTKGCPKWGRAMADLKDARQRIAEARADLKKHQVSVIVDPAGKRVSAMLGIKQESYNRWQPILLPVGLQLGGLLFIWLAFSGSSPRQDDPPMPELSPRKDQA